MSAVEGVLAASRDGELCDRQINHPDKQWIQNFNNGPQGDPCIP